MILTTLSQFLNVFSSQLSPVFSSSLIYSLEISPVIFHFSPPSAPVRRQARQNWRTGSLQFTPHVPRRWLASTTGRTQCDCCEPRSASWSRRSTWTRRWRRWETCSCLLSLTPRRGRPYWSRYRAGILIHNWHKSSLSLRKPFHCTAN